MRGANANRTSTEAVRIANLPGAPALLFRGRGRSRRPGLFGRRGLALPLPATQACPQRRHQVDDVGVLGLVDRPRLVALFLLGDQRLQRLFVTIDELARVE